MAELTDYTNAITPAATMAGTIAYNEKMSRRERKRFEQDRAYQEQYNAGIYAKQRADALSDWTAQNKYNSPQEQMKRLKEANINPHLAYSRGSVENAGGVVRSSNAPADLPKPPETFGTRQPLGLEDYARVLNINAQTENTEMATKNAALETTLKGLAILGKSTENEKSLVDLDVKKRTADIMVDKLFTELGLVGAQYENTLTTGSRLKERLNLDENIKGQILSNLKNTGQLQTFELWAKKNGLDGSDPLYMKSLLKLILTGEMPK